MCNVVVLKGCIQLCFVHVQVKT